MIKRTDSLVQRLQSLDNLPDSRSLVQRQKARMAHRPLNDQDLSDDRPSQVMFYHVSIARILLLKKGLLKLGNQRRTSFLCLLHNKSQVVERNQQPSQLVAMTIMTSPFGSLVDPFQSSALQRPMSVIRQTIPFHLWLDTIGKVPWIVRKPS